MIGSKSDNNFDSVIFYLGFLAHGLFVQFVESFKLFEQVQKIVVTISISF